MNYLNVAMPIVAEREYTLATICIYISFRK